METYRIGGLLPNVVPAFILILHVPLQRVDEAVYSIQEITGELAHTALVVGTKVLPFAPIPGLAEAADILLNIWDAVQMVDVCVLRSPALNET